MSLAAFFSKHLVVLSHLCEGLPPPIEMVVSAFLVILIVLLVLFSFGGTFDVTMGLLVFYVAIFGRVH